MHGEQNNMGRLRAALQSRYKDRDEDIKIHTPRNLETLRLSFRGEKVAKARARPSPRQQLTLTSGVGHRRFGAAAATCGNGALGFARVEGLLVHPTPAARPS